MSANFGQKDADQIGEVLAAESVSFETDHFRLKLADKEERRTLVLQIYPEVTLGKTRGMLVVVYTGNSHLQLHNCTGYVTSDELGEVTFVSEKPAQLSGLVVERGASCSLYGGMHRDLISSDFTQLGVEAMLSGVAMSLVEDILSTDDDAKE